MTHTCPRANGIRCPFGNMNLVMLSFECRTHRPRKARPSRSTTTWPRPTVGAYGGRLPHSWKTDLRNLVYWITTVRPPSRWPLTERARVPSMETSQRCCLCDHQNLKCAAGYDTR